MRVNIYSEEITSEVELVTKGEFAGVRIFLHSADQLHSTRLDDDRSAVTFWIPQTSTAALDLESTFGRAMGIVRQFINDHSLASR